MAKPKKGDTVVVNRFGGLIKHYGVYAGNGKVIHRTEKGVSEVSLNTFCKNSPTYYIEPAYKPKKAKKRAKSRVGEKGYNLVTNNCEHFSNWCSTGKKSSKQVKNYSTGAAIGAAAAAGAIGLAILDGLFGKKR